MALSAPFRLITLSLALFLSASTLYGQIDPRFTWVNPRPTGDVLYDVAVVAPGTLVAVSYNGVIHRSTDAGSTWKPVHFELRGSLTTVVATNGLVIAGGQAGRAHYSTDEGITWTYAKIPDYPYTVGDIHIISRDHIVVAGMNLSYSAKIAVTRDGMKTWNVVDPDSSGYIFTGIDFIDDRHGWVSGSPGVLLRTEDGGDTWMKEPSLMIPGKALNALAFRNRDTGVVAGDVGRILVTHDGGASWTETRMRPVTVYREATWLDDSTIVLIGEGEQLRSTDAGLTWVEMSAEARLFGLGFGLDGREGMAVGPNGEMVYTKDGGREWRKLRRGTTGYRLFDLDFADEQHGVGVGENGTVLYTHDSGMTWTPRSINNGGVRRLDRVVCSTPDTMIALGDTRVFLSVDGGHEWFTTYQTSGFELRDLFVLPDGIGWAVGENAFLKTTDRGSTWSEMERPPSSSLTAVYARDQRNLYVTDEGGVLYISSDAGTSWVRRPTRTAARFSMICASSNGRTITLGWDRGLMVSTGAGLFWEERRTPGNAVAEDHSFLTPEIGWVGTRDGPMLSTTDGGRSWSEHEYGVRSVPGGLSFLSVVDLIRPGYGHLAGNHGFVLRFAESTSEVAETSNERSYRARSGRLTVGQSDRYLIVEGCSGERALRIYDLMGRLIHTVEAEAIVKGTAVVSLEYFPEGHIVVVKEGERTGMGLLW